MSRYDKYFLQHLLWLEDDFCHYYVQDDFWGREEILDVECVIFDWKEDAEQLMVRCINWAPQNTIGRLRRFLASKCLSQYQVYRMNDRQVVRTAAREFCMYARRTVIKPKIGWAVQVNPETREPVQPISVDAPEDLDGLLAELKVHLDAIVADRQHQTDQMNAKLAEMNVFEKAWEHGKRTLKANPQYWMLKNTVDTVRAIPDTAKTAGKLLATMGGISSAAMKSIRGHTMEPINDEVAKAVAPLVETAEQAKQATAMAQVLLDDDDTYDVLVDFGKRYIKATHPLDIQEYGFKAASIVMTIIASIAAMIYTGGAGAAGTVGNLLAKADRLRKAAPVVDKLFRLLKCVGDRTRLPKAMKSVTNKSKKITKKKSKGGVPKVEQPEKIDKNKKKGYGGDTESPKKAPEDDNKPRKIENKPPAGPSRTNPSGKKGGKPHGERTPETGSQKQKHKRENESADTLADAGYDVDQGPHAKLNGKNPDYKIEGEYFDCLSPDTDSVDQVRKGISRKVKSGQTDRIILNLDDTSLEPIDIAEILQRKPKQGLKEVIGIKNGKITHIYP